MGTNIVIPTPIEETHPQVGEMLKWWSNERHYGIVNSKKLHRPVLSLDSSYHVDILCKEYLKSLGYTFPQFSKVGRNDTCPCGSGKKYKKCHGG